MAFTVEQRPGTAGDRSGTVYVLGDDGGACRAEVWPFTGFNCLRWQVRTPAGSLGDVLYVAPDWETNPVPTRSGHPVLFPFPNRLRGGHLEAGGKVFQLPLNDPAKANAIHGFTPRVPWRVIGTDAGSDFAAVTGEFRLSVDDPAHVNLWPADATIRLTYRLTASALRVEAEVTNPSAVPLPFGLGYHPYFRIPTAPDATADDLVLWTAATTQWETVGGIPTGRQILPEYPFDVNLQIENAVLDNLYGSLQPDRAAAGRLPLVARLFHPAHEVDGVLSVRADDAFRDLVLFTPVHRKAVAIEPYTCPTDAAHLQAAGQDAGWRELPPGGQFTAAVEYSWDATKV